MAVVRVVLFRAFNQDCKEVFFNKSPEEIHEVLMDICDTYVPVGILKYEEFNHEPLSLLEQFDRPEKSKNKII